MDNWTTFCFKMKKTGMHSEHDVEVRLVDLLDLIFGWNEMNGNVKEQVAVQMGHETKYADVVLSRNGKNVLVFELKHPDFIPHAHEEGQLYSYMAQLKSEIGVITNGSRMWLYYCPWQNSRLDKVAEIDIDEADNDGREFADLLTFDGFDCGRMAEYCQKRLKSKWTERAAEELGKKLCTEEGKRLIVESLIASNAFEDKYKEAAVIEKAFEKLIIERTRSRSKPQPPVKPPHPVKPHPVKPPYPEESKGFSFTKKGIPEGSTIVFAANPAYTATVIGNKEVEFEGSVYKLSPLARLLYERIGKVTKSGAYRGAEHFTYKGTVLLNCKDVE